MRTKCPHKEGNIQNYFFVPMRKTDEVFENLKKSFMWGVGLGYVDRKWHLYSLKTTMSMGCPDKTWKPNVCVYVFVSLRCFYYLLWKYIK